MCELRCFPIIRPWVLSAAICWGGSAFAASSLTMEQIIPLPRVEGRIDHFAIDTIGHRLFVAALGNNSVEVLNLSTGKTGPSIRDVTEPQGVCFVAEFNRLYVANGGDGSVRIFDGAMLTQVGTVKFDDDADNLRYDSAAKLLYVGHGSGALGAIDVTTNKIAFDVPLPAHPESFQLEPNGARIFVNVPGAHQVAVIDRLAKKVVALWSVGFAAANYPMVLDEPHHRLFIGCRLPARLIVFDTESGKVVSKLALHGDCDDLFFDPTRHQIYASCGEGYVDVFTQIDPDHYELKDAVKTENKARTCFVVGNQLYLAVPKRGDQPAEVRQYRIGP